MEKLKVLKEENIVCKVCKKEIIQIHEVRKYHKKSLTCNPCRNNVIAIRNKKWKKENPAEYLLYKSCESSIERGNENYTRSPYAHVRCQWKKPKDMLKSLIKETDFWNCWKQQTKEYIENGEKIEDRPTIDRIDESGDYKIGNIQVLPMKDNSIKASSNECFVYIIKGVSLMEIKRFNNIKEAGAALGFPYTVVNSGKIIGINLGDGYKAIVSSEKSKDRSTESAKYLMAVNFKQPKFLENGDVEIIRTQEIKLLSGISFGMLDIEKP